MAEFDRRQVSASDVILALGQKEEPTPGEQKSEPGNGPQFGETWRKAGWLGALLVLFSKLKLVGLLLLKFSKSFISAIFMLWAYAAMYGWKFGIGFVALLAAHEVGHVLAARRERLPVTAPIFIPFVGAFVALKGQPADARMEAVVALGGPVAGTVATAAVLGLYYLTGQPLLLALVYTGAFLNLFNLVPAHPLDGGRIASAVSLWLWALGIPALAYLAWTSSNPLLWLILVLAALQASKAWKYRGDGYYRIPAGQRWRFGIAYVLLITVLAAGILVSQDQ
ncbi:MAG: site-2 protease family protein [Syntrophothermus sp.]